MGATGVTLGVIQQNVTGAVANATLTNSSSIEVRGAAIAHGSTSATANANVDGLGQHVIWLDSGNATASLTNNGELSVVAVAVATASTNANAAATVGVGVQQNANAVGGDASLTLTNTSLLSLDVTATATATAAIANASATIGIGVSQAAFGGTGNATVSLPNSGAINIDANALANGTTSAIANASISQLGARAARVLEWRRFQRSYQYRNDQHLGRRHRQWGYVRGRQCNNPDWYRSVRWR